MEGPSLYSPPYMTIVLTYLRAGQEENSFLLDENADTWRTREASNDALPSPSAKPSVSGLRLKQPRCPAAYQNKDEEIPSASGSETELKTSPDSSFITSPVPKAEETRRTLATS